MVPPARRKLRAEVECNVTRTSSERGTLFRNSYGQGGMTKMSVGLDVAEDPSRRFKKKAA